MAASLLLKLRKVQQAVPYYAMAVFHDEGHKEHDPDVEIQITVVGTYQDTGYVKLKIVLPIQIASVTYKDMQNHFAMSKPCTMT